MRTRTALPALAFAFASLGGLACSGAGTSHQTPSVPDVPIAKASNVPRDRPSQSALGTAVAANNAFALSLYGQVAPAANGGNVITSPLSATLALTMTYAGAKGQTAAEMASALQLQGDAPSIFDGQNALSQALTGRAAAALASDEQNAKNFNATAPTPGDYALEVVNSVWGEKTYTWAAPFLGVLAKSYGTGVYEEDFIHNPAGATGAINAWVSTETADKINNLIPALDDSARMVLVNAVHLKLPWATPFQVSQTSAGKFTRGDGTQVSASFMHQDLEVSYAETAQAQVVSLPLAGNELSVVFALPKTDLASLVSSLTESSWAAMTTPSVASVVLSVPKFSFTSKSFSLAKPLQALGMKTVFDPAHADLKGLCAAPPDGRNLYVSDVIQKAMMAVSENGVEAAAATAVIVSGTAAPSKQVTLTLDHPFLVSIVDSSGAIVFLGQINDPADAGSK